ncbi:MAG TPA: ATP-binding cassette domain-containing protein [Myxococcales bacterium LLY-WYZ-16_1]|nr:ATP-binding cassette domain-containing protein [Myxococcales bacterium LLY-WYZ-16_1]
MISARGLYKIFGPKPAWALERVLANGSASEIFEETGHRIAVADAYFDVSPEEIFVVMGLSGSGKSTLLRLVNRLIEPTAGTVLIAGVDVTAMDRRALIDLRRKDLSMVFQSFALMPHLSVWENVAFGLHIAGMRRRERKARAMDALAKVGLEAHAASRPDELSGGMQQRVGLARALAAEPTVLLMDEAFSALDPLLRKEMQEELMRLRQEQGLTIMFVSHDLEEAVGLGDRIALMEEGRILQIGEPEDLIEHPFDGRVRSFFGDVRTKERLLDLLQRRSA